MPGVAFPPVGPVGHGSPPSSVLCSATTATLPVSGRFAPAWRDILVSTTILIAGLHHAACILATPGSVQPLAGMHAGSLLTCWRGFRQVGLEPFPVLTHWATTTNFMGLLPFPRFRAYLGATSARSEEHTSELQSHSD